LQACADSVQRCTTLRQYFDEGLTATKAQEIGQMARDIVFAEWTRKMMHARINEFLSARQGVQLRKKGKRAKGGHTLRDTLCLILSNCDLSFFVTFNYV
jgi:hypothetical protein